MAALILLFGCSDPGLLDAPCQAGEVRPCGPCKEQICTGSGWGECVDVRDAVDEICDGEDNDCDGDTDEGLIWDGSPCGTDVGECVAGVKRCIDGVRECVGSVEPVPEACDGKDNDCDGMTDNMPPQGSCYTGPEGTLGVGVCSAGALLCRFGEIQCVGEILPGDLGGCGIDGDCDGKPDGAEPQDILVVVDVSGSMSARKRTVESALWAWEPLPDTKAALAVLPDPSGVCRGLTTGWVDPGELDDLLRAVPLYGSRERQFDCLNSYWELLYLPRPGRTWRVWLLTDEIDENSQDRALNLPGKLTVWTWGHGPCNFWDLVADKVYCGVDPSFSDEERRVCE